MHYKVFWRLCSAFDRKIIRIEHPLWKTIPYRPAVSESTNSRASMDQVISWIKQCQLEHSSCAISADATLPTRVLDLSNDKVRLHISNGEREEYVSLSHTRGLYPNGKMVCQTTKSNISNRLMDIPWNDLVQGYQEAITVCRDLGYRYLWIDTLCIISDDTDDWVHEVGQIDKIYGNAMLTIFPTGTSSHDETMFHQNSARTVSVSHKDKTYQFQASQRIKHMHINPETGSFPLVHRAWVLQERLLSKRVLHFGRSELFWECCEAVKCQCSVVDRTTDSRLNFSVMAYQARKIRHNLFLLFAKPDALSADIQSSAYALTQRFQTPYSAFEFQKGIIPHIWRQLVQEYSMLQRSKNSDIYAGISGLARQMQGLRHSRYLAGLWEDSLWTDLLWIPRAYRVKEGESTAPSWSWASIAGMVTWNANEFLGWNPDFLDAISSGGTLLHPRSPSDPLFTEDYDPILGRKLDLELGWPNIVDPSTLECKLLKAECRGDGNDGTISASGHLKVSGYLMADDFPYSKFIQPKTNDRGLDFVRIGGYSAATCIDDKNWVHENGKVRLLSPLVLLRVACVRLGPYKDESYVPGYYEWSLLLKGFDMGPPNFKRCGIVVVHQESMERKDSKWYATVTEPTTVILH
jgi:Heterokaryon incompatibility protein (HET)